MDDPLLDDDLSAKDDKPILLFSPWIIGVSAALVYVALVFKLMHWPFNALMLMIGSGLPSGHAVYRIFMLENTPVERAMRAFIPTLAICILFFWMQYTPTAFLFFLGAAIVGAAIDRSSLKRRV